MAATLSTCKLLEVYIWEIEDGIRGKVLEGWKDFERPGYVGRHGVKMSVWGKE